MADHTTTQKSIDVEKAEKISSLLRNIVIVLGAVITVALFLSDKWSDPFPGYVNSMYLGGENSNIAYVETRADNSKVTHSGRLGTVSEIILRNNTDMPVAVEVRIPSIDDEGESQVKSENWPRFTIINAQPTCHLSKDEVQVTNGGFLPLEMVGTIKVPKFPPGCGLNIELMSTQLSRSGRFMNGRVQVFYDGKRANPKQVVKVLGPLRNYFDLIDAKGWGGIVVFILLPLVMILLGVLLLYQRLAQGAASSSEHSREQREEKPEANRE